MNKTKKYIFIFIASIMLASSVLLTIESVTTGAEMANLKKSQEELAIEKKQLENQFVKSISVTQLQEKSGELGFITATNLMYVGERQKVASKN